jgi:hypothetical protein
MKTNAERILKGNNIEISGRVQLNGVAPQPAKTTRPAAAPSTSAQVNIIENTPDFALIEVTCGCGQKIQIKCDYITKK